MQRWACLFVFQAVSNNRLEELRSTIEDCDVVWMFADYKHALEAFRPIKDALKGKTLVLYREMVTLGLVQERIAELKAFIEEIGSAADRIVIHYPRHRIVWDAELERFETIRAGLVMPYVFVMNFATKRQLRFVHYQAVDKYWKGSDIVDKLKHLPHVIVGFGPGTVWMRLIEVMRLQAASELIVHPTRVDTFSRFTLHGILLECVPVLMLTDAGTAVRLRKLNDHRQTLSIQGTFEILSDLPRRRLIYRDSRALIRASRRNSGISCKSL